MNKIINISDIVLNDEVVKSTNSRDVYNYLEIDTPYSMWIKRVIEKYDFIENVDFTTHKFVNGKVAQIDYIVTLDMAKELCMITNTQRGKETRKYFISVEKQAKKPLSVLEQISLIAQGTQQINERIEVLERTKRLENWQEKGLHDIKNKKAYEIIKALDIPLDDTKRTKIIHSKIWKSFRNYYHIPRFNELPAIKYEEGISYINSLTVADFIL